MRSEADRMQRALDLCVNLVVWTEGLGQPQLIQSLIFSTNALFRSADRRRAGESSQSCSAKSLTERKCWGFHSVNSKTNYCWEFSSILLFSFDVFYCTGVNIYTFEDKAITLAIRSSDFHACCLLQLHYIASKDWCCYQSPSCYSAKHLIVQEQRQKNAFFHRMQLNLHSQSS